MSAFGNRFLTVLRHLFAGVALRRAKELLHAACDGCKMLRVLMLTQFYSTFETEERTSAKGLVALLKGVVDAVATVTLL